MKYRIGIDVGGTNTDAVILASDTSLTFDYQHGIIAWHKSPTTPDVTSGIASALHEVLKKSGIDTSDILFLSIGTTHFLNAVVEADSRRLSKVAVIRLSGPYTTRCPPFIDFPPRLRTIIEGHVAFIDGGLEIDGKEISPISVSQVRRQCEIIRKKGIQNVVLVGVFSPLAHSGTQEDYVKRIIEGTLGKGDVNVVCSKDIGHIGLLERENAAILNAAILSFARCTINAYEAVLRRFDLHCPLYLTQLDGTLVPAALAASTPVRTFSNGPTNSMRGASFLAGLNGSSDAAENRKSMIVVDVGGTTTDVGVLLPSGFPRKAAAFTDGGVRTSFSMPDIYSIGLGGGSRVQFSKSGSASVGPDSVGHQIRSSALIFGGDTLTATDIAVAADLPSTRTVFSEAQALLMRNCLSQRDIEVGVEAITRSLEGAIDKMKTDPEDVALLLVGGGAVIVPSTLKGVSEIIRPPYFDVANAVGAAIARVSGIVDRIEVPGGTNGTIEAIIRKCKDQAVESAVRAGAVKDSVEIAEVSVIQLPYVANHASRITVRAVGDLDLNNETTITSATDVSVLDQEADEEVTRDHIGPRELYVELERIDPSTYRPRVTEDGVWMLSETDAEWIAEGCAVLGCGGGGATYAAFLMARHAIRNGHKIRVVGSDYLKDHDALILPCGFMGSPSVSSERIASGEEIPTACTKLMRYLGVENVSALISDEIGGKNGLEPMLLTMRSGFDLPIIDGDLMGRAYPKLNQIVPCIFKENGLYPVAAADGVGNCLIVPTARNNAIVEDVLRAACTALGSSMALSICPLRVAELPEHAIVGTTSQSWRIGRAIAVCRKSNNLKRVAEQITYLQGGQCLFVGKIIDVQREIRGGFTHGKITVAPLGKEERENSSIDGASYSTDTRLVIPFQNENICANLVGSDGSTKTICSVPDLIAVLDSQNASSISTQDYRYGLRVTVLGQSCDPRWTTPKGLEIGGPDAFSLPVKHSPIGKYSVPKSVIEEYRVR